MAKDWFGGLRRFQPERSTILAIAGYGLLAILITWPLVTQLDTHIPGDLEREDHLVHQWTFWWVKEALSSGLNPFHTELMFYPEGISLTSHNIAWLNILFWLPLQAIVGQVAAYNLLYLTIFVVNGLGAYLLGRELTGSKPAAFTGGVTFAFWTYIITHFDHPNLILVGWIPLALLYLHRTMERQQRRDMLLTVLFVVLTGITRWQLLILAGIILGFYVAWRLVSDDSCRTRANALRLGQIVLLSGLLLLPLATPLIAEQWLGDGPAGLLYEHNLDGQADLLAYLVPSRYHPIWGDAVGLTEAFNSFIYNRLYIPFLGYTILIVAFIGVFSKRRQAALWLVMAIFLLLLALGPVLRIKGVLYPNIPMPYRLIEDVYFIRLLRRPDRFNIVLSLPVAMLVTLGVAAIRERISRTELANLVTAILIGLILFEATPYPLPTFDTRTVPAWYEQLAEEPGDFAIVNIPLERVPYKYYLFYQTTHGKALVEGRVSRVPPQAYDYIDSIPFLAQLRSTGTIEIPADQASDQLEQLAADGVRYVVVHKQLMGGEALEDWRQWVGRSPIFEDERLLVYQTGPGSE